MKRFTSLTIFLLAPVAWSQPVDGSDPSPIFKAVFEAITHRQWDKVAAFGITLLVLAARAFGGNFIPFLRTKLGGILLTLALGATGTISTALLAGESISLDLIIKGIGIGVTAAGGWSIFKSLREHFMVDKAVAAGAAAASVPPAGGLNR